MELDVVVHHDQETGGYWAEVMQLPGCFAAGHTREELQESLQEAVSLYLEDKDVESAPVAERFHSVERYRLSEDRKLLPI
jgi:predicted RNase H-like HicB family nuclease